MDTNPSRESQVRTKMGMLMAEIEVALKFSADLTARLQPVLRYEMETESKPPNQGGAETLCPLADDLQEGIEKILDINNSLASIVRRLEV